MQTTAYQWTPLIVMHAAFAATALLLGVQLLWRRKGSTAHRRLGWLWVLLMAAVALSSFGIYRERFSWIHGLSVLTLASLAYGVWHARRHQVHHHRFTMLSLFFGALVITGLFTLLPQRLIGQALWAGAASSTPAPSAVAAMSAEARIGEKAFNEVMLSASGKQSCASCHAPHTGHAAPNALAVQPGGAALDRQGLRNSQPLRYLARNTPFHFNHEGKAIGGFFWDGRADTLARQAEGPLLGEREMGNRSRAEVVTRLAQTAWAGEFRQVFGAGILQDAERAFERLTFALERYQIEDESFNGYSSKFDAYLRGQVQLSAQEQRGLQWFNDARKGNCAACHVSEKDKDGRHPVFTDFSYDNLGVPRNAAIADNRDPKFFDLGLCGRAELRQRADLCGAFRVPSLRNVALRQAYFHNGRYTSLREVMEFYVQRDTDPAKWYPRGPDGVVRKFDDLPRRHHGNVNTSEVPYDRQRGQSPALNDAEIDDVIAFLRTLTDGWRPN
jgi:cytochrome c peroxidase